MANEVAAVTGGYRPVDQAEQAGKSSARHASSDAVIDYGESAAVTEAIRSRRSIRSYLPDVVPNAILEHILTTTSRAPSGTNIQLWHTLVIQGEIRLAVCNAVSADFDDSSIKPDSAIPYYPERWFSPFVERRRKVGWDLYGLLGIGKGDKTRMHAQHKLAGYVSTLYGDSV